MVPIKKQNVINSDVIYGAEINVSFFKPMIFISFVGKATNAFKLTSFPRLKETVFQLL